MTGDDFPMAGPDGLGLRLRQHYRATADARPASGQLDVVLARTATTQQRPGWLVGLRDARLSSPTGLTGQRGRTTWLLIGLVLLLALTVGVAFIGSLIRPEEPMPPRPMPAALAGDWQGSIAPAAGSRVPAGTYTLNVAGTALVRGPDGTELDWLGRAVEFLPAAAVPEESGDASLIVRPLGTLIVKATGSCGEGRYVVTPFDAETISFTEPVDACIDRVRILRGALVWRPPPLPAVWGSLPDGRIHAEAFSEPFSFVLPELPPGSAEGWNLLGTRWSQYPGAIRTGGCCWASWLVDDQPVNADVCDYTKGRLADIPATPEAVGDWLRSSARLTVSEPTEVPVDGRTALRYDVSAADTCRESGDDAPGSAFGIGFRIYAIPTEHDTIIWSLWSDEGSKPAVKAGMDALIRSMTFD